MLLLSVSSAHVGALLAGIDVDPRQDRVLLETSFGVVQQTDQGYAWTCHEVLTRSGSIATPLYARGPDGTLLSVVKDLQGRNEDISLYRSVNGGCDWTEVDFGGALATELIWVGEAALVGTDDGRVFRSEDAGETWTVTDRQLAHAVRAFSEQDGVAYTVELIGFRAHIHSTADGGVTWDQVEVGVGVWRNDALEHTRVAAVVDGELLLMVDALGGDTLVRVPDPDAPVAVLEVEGDLLEANIDGDGVIWVIEGSRRLYRSDDGTTFTVEEAAPASIGLGADDVVWTSGFAEFNGALMSHAPQWEPVLPVYDIVGPMSCPTQSEHVVVCEPLWDELKARLDVYEPSDSGDSRPDSDPDRPDETGDTGGLTPPDDCGCSATGGGAWLGLLALFSARGRRRRDRPQGTRSS